MLAELDYDDGHYKGLVTLDVTSGLSSIIDIFEFDNASYINEDGDDVPLVGSLKEEIFEAIADRLYNEWGNGFGWEDKVRI